MSTGQSGSLMHSECLTGDLLGSLRCDCGDQLRGALREIGKQGSGILLYLAQEGRDIGLINKLRAYQLQDLGSDTVDANEQLGFEVDERVYLTAAEMLHQLSVKSVRLMTNNPEKITQLRSSGVNVVERVAHFPSNSVRRELSADKSNPHRPPVLGFPIISRSYSRPSFNYWLYDYWYAVCIVRGKGAFAMDVSQTTAQPAWSSQTFQSGELDRKEDMHQPAQATSASDDGGWGSKMDSDWMISSIL